MTKIVCPVCGGSILYHRVDDGEMMVRVISDEAYEELGGKVNGYTSVRCEAYPSHIIPDELRNTVIEIAQEFGY